MLAGSLSGFRETIERSEINGRDTSVTPHIGSNPVFRDLEMFRLTPLSPLAELPLHGVVEQGFRRFRNGTNRLLR